MNVRAAHVEHARRVADAVLYEGYLLYPYRKSAQKNQARFQFGVLMPPAYRAVDPCEPSGCVSEFLAEARDEAPLWVSVRFLRLRRRTVLTASPDGGLAEVATLTVAGTEHTPWDEAAEYEHRVDTTIGALLAGEVTERIHLDGENESEPLGQAGQLRWHTDPVDAVVRMSAQRMDGPYQALRVRVALENGTEPQTLPRKRADGLAHALISAHLLAGLEQGSFLSPVDPPEWAAPLAASCARDGAWPVLAGPDECDSLMLISPIILYDHPQIAAESAGDLFDATEIDEILTLRTLAMTDAEKAEARATDPRAAALVDRVDGLPPEMLEKMHGAIRYLEPAAGPVSRTPVPRPPDEPPEFRTPGEPGGFETAAPWWDPGADRSVSPETDHVMIDGTPVAKGTRVIMRPGSRRADAQDLFLAGREGVVEAVLFDVDGQVHLAVTHDSDPVLADLQRSHGRFLYFAPDEIEPVRAQAGGRPAAEEDT